MKGIAPGVIGEVRKHQAPNGALRPTECSSLERDRLEAVRKHRAPNGALRRRGSGGFRSHSYRRQKAPSAKRCIKTPLKDIPGVEEFQESESTERQTVH